MKKRLNAVMKELKERMGRLKKISDSKLREIEKMGIVQMNQSKEHENYFQYLSDWISIAREASLYLGKGKIDDAIESLRNLASIELINISNSENDLDFITDLLDQIYQLKKILVEQDNYPIRKQKQIKRRGKK